MRLRLPKEKGKQPLLSCCASIDQIIAEGEPLPPFDVHVPMMSVPALVGTTPENVPPSTVDTGLPLAVKEASAT